MKGKPDTWASVLVRPVVMLFARTTTTTTPLMPTTSSSTSTISPTRIQAKNKKIVLALLFLLLSAGYVSHRYASYKMNSVALVKSPINDIDRVCPKPTTYDVIDNDKNPIDPKSICLCTLTDSKKADFIQRYIRWRNFDNLLEMTWPNKQAYTQKHGYSLYDESDALDTTRPPSWSKILAAKRLLTEENCQWVVWLDADTVVMNSAKKIQDFLPRDKDILFTIQKGGSYNAGAWIIKNTPWSLEFLNHWWNMKEFVHPKGMATSGDNAALKSYLLNMDRKEFEKHIGVPPRCNFNSVTVFLTPTEYQQSKHLPITEQKRYMDEEYYHKGDLIAHIAGTNNKIDTAELLLKDAV